MSDQYPPVVRIFGATTAAMRTLARTWIPKAHRAGKQTRRVAIDL